jgi:outer membrane protein assembly factor BamB
LHRGANALDWAALDKLAEIRNRTFATEAELDEWLKGSGLDAKVTAEAVKVIATTVEKAHDAVLCFDAAKGDVLWRKDIPGEPRGWDNSGTPLVAEGRLYILGTGNALYCLDVKTGDVVWKGKAEAGSGSSSAALLDGKVIVVAGPLMAFDAKTGDVLWKQPAVGHSHASPAFWVKDGKTYVLCNSGNDLVCVDPADGKLLWKTSPGGHNSTPAIEGDWAVVQGQGSGITGYRLAVDKAEKLWNLPHNDRGASPVLLNGHAYVLSGSGNAKAMCIKADTGQVAWEEKAPNQEISSPIAVGDKLLAFVAGAKELWMLKAAPERFVRLAKTRVGGANCSTPTVVGTRLYLRTEKGVGCYELAPAEP